MAHSWTVEGAVWNLKAGASAEPKRAHQCKLAKTFGLCQVCLLKLNGNVLCIKSLIWQKTSAPCCSPMMTTSCRMKVRQRSGITATTKVQLMPNVLFQHLHCHMFTTTAINVFKFLLTSDLKISLTPSKQQRFSLTSIFMLSIIIPRVSTFITKLEIIFTHLFSENSNNS